MRGEFQSRGSCENSSILQVNVIGADGNRITPSESGASVTGGSQFTEFQGVKHVIDDYSESGHNQS